MIELGVPFSDPLADGGTIQKANTDALNNGVTLKDCLNYVKDARSKGFHTPVVLMGYYNPFMQYGEEKLVKECQEVGVHGLIVVDLLFDEAESLLSLCEKYKINFIPLIAPTSTDDRIAKIAKIASGYVYCVSLTGVTGARTELPKDLKDFISRVKKYISLPIAIGFGLSTRTHFLSVGKLADGAVMGSAIVKRAAMDGDDIKASAKRIESFVTSVVKGD